MTCYLPSHITGCGFCLYRGAVGRSPARRRCAAITCSVRFNLPNSVCGPVSPFKEEEMGVWGTGACLLSSSQSVVQTPLSPTRSVFPIPLTASPPLRPNTWGHLWLFFLPCLSLLRPFLSGPPPNASWAFLSCFQSTPPLS